MRAILAHVSIGESIEQAAEFRDLLSTLERYLPEVLREVHPVWARESLDGVYSELARKTGECEIELAGLCIFISDQTLTPLHVRLQISPSRDEITWLDCRLGEAGPDGTVRIPYERRRMLAKPAVSTNWDQLDWVYHVGFGERR